MKGNSVQARILEVPDLYSPGPESVYKAFYVE